MSHKLPSTDLFPELQPLESNFLLTISACTSHSAPNSLCEKWSPWSSQSHTWWIPTHHLKLNPPTISIGYALFLNLVSDTTILTSNPRDTEILSLFPLHRNLAIKTFWLASYLTSWQLTFCFDPLSSLCEEELPHWYLRSPSGSPPHFSKAEFDEELWACS